MIPVSPERTTEASALDLEADDVGGGDRDLGRVRWRALRACVWWYVLT